MLKKILVVDDEPDILQVVIFRLEKAGYDAIPASDGKKALELLRKGGFDLVILDLRMPIMDGYEVCRVIKREEKLKKIPVIVLTASIVTDVSKVIRDIKADDYLIKPFESEDLLGKVKQFTTQR